MPEIKKAFCDIRSIILRLRNEHPNSLETINQEIRNLLVQVGTKNVHDVAEPDQQPPPQSEDNAKSSDLERATQIRDSSSGNNVDPAESQPVVDALQWLDSEIPIESSEDSTAITPFEQEPRASEFIQPVSAQHFSGSDRPNPKPFQIAEIQIVDRSPSPSLSSAPLLLSSCGDSEPLENTFVDIEHTANDAVISLLPTKHQWQDFPAIIQHAKKLGAEIVGAFKIVLPEGVAGLRTQTSDSGQPSYSYNTRTRTNGTISVKMTRDDSGFEEAPATSEVTADLTAGFDDLIADAANLQKVRYRTDLDAQTLEQRQRLGMPLSPIWPLKGDSLPETRARVPGIHWPYAYEANDAFGALFTMHREDWDLCSINYIYEGTKSWTVVSAKYADLLEQNIRDSDPTFRFSDCAQIMRHYPTYVPTKILDKWKIPHKDIRQVAGEIIFTFPRVYHQGFSAGSTFAEAVNYADKTWNAEAYKECNSRQCPKGFITKEMMELRDKDSDQLSVAGTDDSRTSSQNGQIDRNSTTIQPVDAESSSSAKKGPNWKHFKKANPHIKSPQSRKRKLATQTQQTTPKKSAKIETNPGKELSIILKEVVSSTTVRADAIYQEFAEKSSDIGKDPAHNRLSLLTRLFFALASPDAFCQLRDACHSVRHSIVPIPQSGNSIAETMKALDGLETTVSMASIIRRYHLVSLVSRRSQRQREHAQRNLRHVPTLNDGNETSGRSDSRALASMMAEAYPDLKPIRVDGSARDEYQKKLRSLKDRLVAGQRWLMMEKEFSSGILALVPMQGDYELSNTQFEKLPAASISLLLEVLNEHRGDFLKTVSASVSSYISDILYRKDLSRRFLFENTNGTVLKKEPHDSARFIELCEVEESVPAA